LPLFYLPLFVVSFFTFNLHKGRENKIKDFQKIKSPNIHLPTISLIRAGRPCPYNCGEFIGVPLTILN
jgi:hypothetical protein